jgi:hypothetical protein
VLRGLHLTLLVGPVIPVPVPQIVLDALVSIEINTAAGNRSPSGFTLVFTLNNRSPLQTIFLLTAGGVIPLLRVIIVATVNGIPDVLIDGVVTKQSIAPGQDASHSTLTVTGVDLSELMNLIPFDGLPYPAMPIVARVALILAKYAAFGVVPLVIPPLLFDVPIPTDRIPRQQGTDREYLYQLADDVGYVFFIDPGPAPGTSIAYFGPDLKVGVPQPALNYNFDGDTNIDHVSFSFNADAKKLPIVFIQNSFTKIPIPIPVPDISVLNPPLGLIPPLPLSVEALTDTAKLSPVEAALRALTKSSQSSDAVEGQGNLDVLRYGRILKARKLVGVRGVGPAFDGLHYVKSVQHQIKRGEYKQSFTLSRNGLLSTVPAVPA